VLTCIANLSNDEVFTPPEFANRMLDTLAERWAADNDGAEIWADPRVTFLDPVTKSGVFLREITGRLTDGLRDEIPDLRERVDHILTNQVFGIGITYLTSLLARRSVYCSKFANGRHSVARSFSWVVDLADYRRRCSASSTTDPSAPSPSWPPRSTVQTSPTLSAALSQELPPPWNGAD
jgi:hypothetical protein